MSEPTPRWRDPAWRLRWLAPGLALAVALVILARAHLHFFLPFAAPLSNDEGYISAMALRMIHGSWLPYVDAISQRGPILYWIAAAAMKVGGQFSWLPMRWLAMVVGMAVVSLTFAAGAAFTTPMGAGVAALFVTYFLSFELLPWDGLGYNGEVVAVAFALASLLALERAIRPDSPRRDRWLVASGALAALAGLSKQMTLVHVGPSLLWLALGGPGDERPLSRRAVDLARYALGMAIPYALVIGVYAATGHLREFVYYYQRYGRDIFMDPVTRTAYRERLRDQIDHYYMGASAVTAVCLAALSDVVRRAADESEADVTWLERARRHAPGFVLVLQVVCATFGAFFTGRFFPHYFVQVFPFAGLLAARASMALSLDPQRPRDRAPVAGALVLVAGAAVLLGISSAALSRHVRTRRDTDRWYQDPRTDPIVRYVLERTRPEDSIFVWGFRAETHVSAARLPASRFVYSVYPSGVVPWFHASREDEERRVVPGSRRLLLEDLERARPVLVIDAGRSMDGRYMYNYPELRRYLDRNYCFMRYVDGEPVYRRRVGGDCPPADY